MSSTQRHIINKLQVDVVTNDSNSAFDLKDNIDGFLKHDILPFLENYFSTIEEDLHSQVIQIPYLSVDVDTSSTLNYKELKEDVKRALAKEIKRITKLAHPNNEEAKLTTQEGNKETAFLHFLETGTSPWWIRSEETFELSEEEFIDFLESKSFLLKFQTKLINSTFRNRIIQQLSNQQIGAALTAMDAPRFEKIWSKKLDKSFTQLTSADRKILWDCIIDEVIQKDEELFTSRLVFHLVEKLSEERIENKALQRESRVFVELVFEILNHFKSTSMVHKTMQIVQKNESLLKNLSLPVEWENSVKVQSSQDNTENQTSIETNDIQLAQKEDVTVSNTNEIGDFNEVSSEVDTNEESKELKDLQIDNRSFQKSNEEIQPATENDKIESGIQSENTSSRTREKAEESKNAKDQESIDAKFNNDIESIETKHQKEVVKSDDGKEKNQLEETQELSLSQVQESLNELIKKEDRALFKELASIENQPTNNIEKELHINNAGLILLHPYLKDFFNHCELLDEKNNIINKDLAVHLLHYLATKREQQFENNMLFEKVLCGVSIDESIQRSMPLSEELKANAEELLEAVLMNWGVLKNASPDLLRGEFLQRFGKISFKEVNPKITVERKVQDILLDKLPWNIGISRLPWLDHLLFTDW